MLDPNPLNELGRHLLDPADEQRWLAAGIVFARRIEIRGQPFTLTSKFSLAEINCLKNNTIVRSSLQLTGINKC